MSVITALLAGGLVGIRHAFETDHLAAVATLVEERSETPGVVGASWGIGHSLPIIALGLLFVVVGVRLPEAVTSLFEVVVGIILVYLGGRMLVDVVGLLDVHTHEHDDHVHTHLRLGDRSVGFDHHHLSGDSLLVGLLHGFAGSGVLVVLLVSSAPSLGSAVAFLVAFSLLSIVTMAAVSSVWGRTLQTRWTRYLKATAGVVGVVAGLLLVAGQVPPLG